MFSSVHTVICSSVIKIFFYFFFFHTKLLRELLTFYSSVVWLSSSFSEEMWLFFYSVSMWWSITMKFIRHWEWDIYICKVHGKYTRTYAKVTQLYSGLLKDLFTLYSSYSLLWKWERGKSYTKMLQWMTILSRITVSHNINKTKYGCDLFIFYLKQ